MKDDGALLILGLIILAVGWNDRRKLSVHILLVIVALTLLMLACFMATLVVVKRRRLKPAVWNQMSGIKFEDQVARWLKLCGYRQVVKTEYFDRGIDIIATKPGTILGVQVKRSSRPVGVAAVRAAVAGLKSYSCTQAMVVTNSSFTRAAKQLAAVNDCLLVDGIELNDTIVKLGLS